MVLLRINDFLQSCTIIFADLIQPTQLAILQCPNITYNMPKIFITHF